MAERQRLKLVKCRRRDPHAFAYGTYGLIDPYKNAWVASRGDDGYGMDLDEVEEWLTK